MTVFDKAWNFLKADPIDMQEYPDPIDMQEYPPGSGRFMSLVDMMRARNADARKNIQASKLPITPNPNTNTDYPPIPNTVMVNGKEMDRKNFYNQNKNNIMVSPTGNLNDIPKEDRWNPL